MKTYRTEKSNWFLKFLILHLLLIASIQKGSGQVAGTSTLSFIINIPEIALLDIEPEGNNISFVLFPPSDAGISISESGITNSNLWINYTSTKRANNQTRTIQVHLDDDIPEGFELELAAGTGQISSGRGDLGQPTGPLMLSRSRKDLITGIGGSFTGNGLGNGHKLNFTLRVTNFADLKQIQNKTVRLIYTMIDN